MHECNPCRKAAAQGHPDAQEHLSQCYTRGLGVAINRALGFEWAIKAGAYTRSLLRST